jgi:hypothetical protein
MTFYRNVGYSFKQDEDMDTNGGIILCSAMPKPQLERRRFRQHSSLDKRLFDPQLYMCALDVNESRKQCTILASYPWFMVDGLKEYKSSEISLAGWRKLISDNIGSCWTGNISTNPADIDSAVRSAVDFQVKIGCEGIILPSPLTIDSGTDYAVETAWLDAGLKYCNSLDKHLPVYATLAITDTCVRYVDSNSNPLLDLVLDVISARDLTGVYIILEQGSELSGTRYCGNARALSAALRLAHVFTHDCKLNVLTNFFGPFGLALESAGATLWASHWYKSLVRFRLADKIGGGRALPSYWSYPTCADINLQSEFDTLVQSGLLSSIVDNTNACHDLLVAVSSGKSVADIPEWNYAPSNVTAAKRHYLQSMIQQEQLHSQYKDTQRLDYVENWLQNAVIIGKKVKTVLGTGSQTETAHIKAWADAFARYRQDHKV